MRLKMLYEVRTGLVIEQGAGNASLEGMKNPKDRGIEHALNIRPSGSAKSESEMC